MYGMAYSWVGRHAIYIPVWKVKGSVPGFHWLQLVLVQRPVSDTVTGGIDACHKTDAGWRANRRGVSLREFHALTGQPLHVGCSVAIVKIRFFCPKRDRCVLPSHIIHKKQYDVRGCFRLIDGFGVGAIS